MVVRRMIPPRRFFVSIADDATGGSYAIMESGVMFSASPDRGRDFHPVG